MRTSYLLMMAGGVLVSSISQILLKKSAVIHHDRTGWKAQYLNRFTAGGYILLFLAMLITLYVYQFVELKYGAAVESLGYVFVMCLSSLFLGEKITKKKITGNMLIIAGIVLFTLELF